MALAGELARWIIAFDRARIPDAVLVKTKQHLLDSLACAFAALEDAPSRGVLATVGALGGAPDCTIIGSPVRTSAPNAVLANSMLVRSLDLNDSAQVNGIAHPSDNIPVALAVGEWQRSTGLDVLGALVLGYELLLRIPRSEQRPNLWDRTTHSSLAAAAMAGKLMRLSEPQLADALALSLAHANTLSIVRRGELSAAKSLAGGMVAHTAVLAAMLSSAGVSGPTTAVEEWSAAILDGADLAGLVAPQPPTDYRIMSAELKAHPCVIFAQAAVEAALQVHAALAPGAPIELIEVRVADDPSVLAFVEGPERLAPTTKETADHSIPFVVAAALLDGQLTLAQYENDRWFDPAILALIERMEFIRDATLNRFLPGAFPVDLTVHLPGGEVHRALVPHAPGHLLNPMTSDQVQAKFHHFAASVPEARRGAIITEVETLDRASSIQPLAALLRK